MAAEVEIGSGKSGRRGYGFDDIAIVPSRRTRDREDVDIAWELDAFRFELPMLAAASDAIVSPATAATIAGLGAGAVLNLDGLWTRYADADPLLDELGRLDATAGAARLRELYDAEDVKPELVAERIKDLKRTGGMACASLPPQRVEALAATIAKADLDLLVIQGTVVSAEHVSKSGEPLNLKKFIREYDIPVLVGGCASYQAALHLMRTGAVGILVGVGADPASTTPAVLGVGAPSATAIADAAGARMRHLDETGVYVHVVADGGMSTGGDMAKAIACGADGVMVAAPLAAATEAPGRGWHWGRTAAHPSLPRSARIPVPPIGSLTEILVGPSDGSHPSLNLCGALRASMATCGYETVKEFQKAEVVVSPR